MEVKICQILFVYIFKQLYIFSGFSFNLFEFLAFEIFLRVSSSLDSEDSSLNWKGAGISGTFQVFKSELNWGRLQKVLQSANILFSVDLMTFGLVVFWVQRIIPYFFKSTCPLTVVHRQCSAFWISLWWRFSLHNILKSRIKHDRLVWKQF